MVVKNENDLYQGPEGGLEQELDTCLITVAYFFVVSVSVLYWRKGGVVLKTLQT